MALDDQLMKIFDYSSQGKLDEALQLGAKLLGKNVENYHLYNALGQICLAQGNIPEAHAHLELAISHEDHDGEAAFTLALSHAKSLLFQTNREEYFKILDQVQKYFGISITVDSEKFSEILGYLMTQNDLDRPDVPMSTTMTAVKLAKSYIKNGNNFNEGLMSDFNLVIDFNYIEDTDFLEWIYFESNSLKQNASESNNNYLDFAIDEATRKLTELNYNNIDYLLKKFGKKIFTTEVYFFEMKERRSLINYAWNKNEGEVQSDPTYCFKLAEFVLQNWESIGNLNFGIQCAQLAIELDYEDPISAENIFHDLYAHRIIQTKTNRHEIKLRREYRIFCHMHDLHPQVDDVIPEEVETTQKTGLELPAVIKKRKLVSPSINEITELIRSELDLRIVGQENARRVLARHIGNHTYRAREILSRRKVSLPHANLMLIGDTGVGKTESMKVSLSYAMEQLGIPYFTFDCSDLTEAGYVGDNVEDIIIGLFLNSGKNIDLTQVGVVHLDEIDKLASHSGSSHDVSGTGAQEALLKITEGTQKKFSLGRNQPSQLLDTSNILFIGTGSFQGEGDSNTLQKLMQQIRNEKTHGEFGFQMSDAAKKIPHIPDDILLPLALQRFGMIAQITGRFPVNILYENLDAEDLFKILLNDEKINYDGRIPAYRREFLERFNHDIIVREEAMKEMSNYASELQCGARGLNSVCELVLGGILLDGIENKIQITEDYVVTLEHVKQRFAQAEQETEKKHKKRESLKL